MCEKCGSLWLDAGELDKMAFQVQGSIEYCEQEKDKEPEKQAKKCPRCDDFALDKVRFLESDDIYLALLQKLRRFLARWWGAQSDRQRTREESCP